MTDSYKGVRDFYPADQRVQDYMFGAMRRVCQSFGYDEMNASVLELTDLYLAKTSEEIINEQTYTFTDRGDRSVTLRPEMTPTVARMVAERRRDLPMPLRWYSIQNFFRYERPQRGRTREFWQLNVDLFGVADSSADEEIVVLADRVMRELGAQNGMYEVRVNDRNLLRQSVESHLKDATRYQDAVRLIDKMNKMTQDKFAVAWSEYSDTPLAECLGESVELNDLIRRLTERGVQAVFAPTLARGFDYYTGVVFEIFDLDEANPRALAGGGRYDKLIEGYGGPATPAVGFAMGDVSTRDFLETHGLLGPLTGSAQLYIVPLAKSAAPAADLIRSQGVNVALGMHHKKVGDHIKAAEKLLIPFVAVYGDDEALSHEITIKELSSGKETKVGLDKVSEFLHATDL